MKIKSTVENVVCEDGSSVNLFGVSFLRKGDDLFADIDKKDAEIMIKAGRAAKVKESK